jgi:REP element-mobilizing transposase RayT
MDGPSIDGRPLAYFITWSCYGTWLHGEEKGSVDREHNRFGDAFLAADPATKTGETGKMDQPSYQLDAARRRIVLESIVDQARHRGWTLLAVHVRTTHIHVVIQADLAPERVMNTLKAYASRAMNQAGWDGPDRKRWTRHGSTRYLWRTEQLAKIVDYVVRQQGEPLEVFEANHID